MSLDKESPLYESMMMREREMDKQNAGAATDAPTPECDDWQSMANIALEERNSALKSLDITLIEKYKAEAERDAARAEMQHEREGYECAIAYGYAADVQRERAETAETALAALQKRLVRMVEVQYSSALTKVLKEMK